ncbi:MAG: hypothetical protein IJE07_09680 [Clostridia bacterium]|nr:hypothetical protein [Clostridia bacterium]
MKRLLALLTVILLAISLGTATAEGQLHQLHLDVEYDQNIVMARYDVDVLINGEKVAFIDHGKDLDATFCVPEGLCSITFRKVGDEDVYVTTMIGVNRDTDVTCEIHANLKDLEFRSLETNCTSDAYSFEEGEVLDFSGIGMTVASHQVVSSYGPRTAASGKVFVVCQVDFINNTAQDASIMALVSTMAFDGCCDDYEIDCLWSAMYGVGEEITMGTLISLLEGLTRNSEVIRPGKRAIIELVYEVPSDWKVLEVYYAHDDIATGEVEFIIRND